jgi:hypothetical protein
MDLLCLVTFRHVLLIFFFYFFPFVFLFSQASSLEDVLMKCIK